MIDKLTIIGKRGTRSAPPLTITILEYDMAYIDSTRNKLAALIFITLIYSSTASAEFNPWIHLNPERDIGYLLIAADRWQTGKIKNNPNIREVNPLICECDKPKNRAINRLFFLKVGVHYLANKFLNKSDAKTYNKSAIVVNGFIVLNGAYLQVKYDI